MTVKTFDNCVVCIFENGDEIAVYAANDNVRGGW